MTILNEPKPYSNKTKKLKQSGQPSERVIMGKKIFMDPLSLFSHELKTPISSLKLALDLIKKNQTSPQDKQELLHLMDQEINRMMFFISNTLDLRLLQEKGDLMRFEWEFWGDIIEQSIKPFELASREKGIQWKIENLNEDTEVFMDSLWIKQVLNNLISNAFNHSPNNSVIIISSHVTPSGSLRLSVKDEGTGVPPEEKKRLFEAFYKKQTKTGGFFKNTGLGLAIAYAIIKKHQGVMDLLSSEEGQGTLFYFELPKIRQSKKTA
ncbi:MAG: HAMP domain-containing sensor histidine kinase [Bdellovibrionales bacterium]|nr:HAMP domain-containing sensor histidine kinase [Bdellovibrionales bacterium]